MAIRAVKFLVKRNEDRRPPKSISFPFFIVEPANVPDTDLRIQMQANLMRLLVKSNNPLKLYGDIEAVIEVPSLTANSILPPPALAKPWPALRYPTPFGEGNDTNQSPASYQVEESPLTHSFRAVTRQRRREE